MSGESATKVPAPRIDKLKDLFEQGWTAQNSAKVKANAGPSALLDINGKLNNDANEGVSAPV